MSFFSFLWVVHRIWLFIVAIDSLDDYVKYAYRLPPKIVLFEIKLAFDQICIGTNKTLQ